MNFFEHQEIARRRTTELIVYYGLAVVLIVLAIYAVVVLLFTQAARANALGVGETVAFWQPNLFLAVTAATASVVGIGTLYKIYELSGDGGEHLATRLGGRLLRADTSDLAERRLLNVVEEMALASGTPVPRVFLLEEEPGINAFAAGFTPADAVIGVTRGSLRLLSRDELQGVIAHEFSHILNGDMRLNIRLIGVLNGILVIALIGYGLFRIVVNSGGTRVRSSRDKRGGGMLILLLLGLALMAIGYIGVFFGKLIKSAVSRQREFLADASAVQFTRNPDGLAGALKRIGGFMRGSRIANPHAEEVSHLFFANGLRGAWFGLMATHPPLKERICRIDPAFDGRFTESEPTMDTSVPPPPLPRSTPPPLPVAASFAVSAASVTAQAGTPQPQHLAYAADLLASLSPDLRDGLRDPAEAQAMVYALILGRPSDIRARQLDHLTARSGARMVSAVRRHLVHIDAAGAALRLPLASLAIATLRRLSGEQYKAFRRDLDALAAADQEIDLFEYTLLRMVARHLDPAFNGVKPTVIQYYSLKPLREACMNLIATLAWFGTDDPSKAAHAFDQGVAQLSDIGPAQMPASQYCSLVELDKALDLMAATSPLIKRKLVAACTACIAADGVVSIQEAELLRAIADALEVPLPPFVASGAV